MATCAALSKSPLAARSSSDCPQSGSEAPPRNNTENLADDSELADVGQLKGYRDDHPFTAAVGGYRANEFGIYDFAGNAKELCNGWDKSKKEALHVLRGGSWATRSRLLRNTLRNCFTPERRDIFAGFRTCAR